MSSLAPFCHACCGTGWKSKARCLPCAECAGTGLGEALALRLELPAFPERHGEEEAWLSAAMRLLAPYTWPRELREEGVDMAFTAYAARALPEVGSATWGSLLEEALVRGGLLTRREQVLGWSCYAAVDTARPRVEVVLALEEQAHG